MRLFIFAALVPIMAAPAMAQTDLMGRVVACAGLEDDAKRHACFDVLTPELRGNGVKTFGETKKPAATPAEPDEISLGVSAIDRAGDEMVFTMANGQVWKQSDTRQLGGFGKGPWTAEIRKGMVGGFSLSLNGSASIKVKRVK
ncbi:MAG: hypothetical protein EON93_18700 [Burkholderiales bacterium]|nr:MAG: hypothetical protein EON93_18700 [Burkholderiales bacterium]